MLNQIFAPDPRSNMQTKIVQRVIYKFPQQIRILSWKIQKKKTNHTGG